MERQNVTAEPQKKAKSEDDSLYLVRIAVYTRSAYMWLYRRENAVVVEGTEKWYRALPAIGYGICGAQSWKNSQRILNGAARCVWVVLENRHLNID